MGCPEIVIGQHSEFTTTLLFVSVANWTTQGFGNLLLYS